MDGIMDLLEVVSDRLSEVAQSKVVAGDPIKLGEVTLVILSEVNVGLGSGGGDGVDLPARVRKTLGKAAPTEKQMANLASRLGAGMGGSGKVTPVAVIAFTPDGVQVLPIRNKRGLMEKLLVKFPDLIETAQQSFNRLRAESKAGKRNKKTEETEDKE